jgi:outer membrane protein
MKTSMILIAILLGMFSYAEPAPNPPSNQKPVAPTIPGPPLLIATVDMQEVFKHYHRTIVEQQEINIERARIQKDNNQKLATIRQIESDIRILRQQSEDPTLSDKKKAQVSKEYQAKYQEGIQLDKERREFLNRKDKDLNEKMVQRMRQIFDEIRAVVVEKAREENYSFVFDKSGHSTSQVPVLLYSKDATDITSHVLKKLNHKAPSESSSTKTSHESAAAIESVDMKR